METEDADHLSFFMIKGQIAVNRLTETQICFIMNQVKNLCIEVAVQMSTVWSRQAEKCRKGNHRRMSPEGVQEHGVTGNTCSTPSQEEALLLSMRFICDSAYDFLLKGWKKR